MNESTQSSTSLTSYSKLFGQKIDGYTITKIEIPLIQRDYAQGRNTETVNRIRKIFIDALCKALMQDSEPVDLDFVFGDVEGLGKFYPLDGQQRLTTLFLLHCYLAWRVGITLKDEQWTKFSYATRPGARDFCVFLVESQPDFSGMLSDWIKDQAGYLPTWEHDPTIQSMLVVLDELNDRFKIKQPDVFESAWERLISEDHPAIRFHTLPMKSNNLTDELYIKMNSRGKPLTKFENFKAHFEGLLKTTHPSRYEEFSKKVDTEWSDILWYYRGEDNVIDDEFMRYFRFVTEVCAWKTGIGFTDTTNDYELYDLAEKVYSSDQKEKAEANLEFLFQAFNSWENKTVKDVFENILTDTLPDDYSSTPLLMFNPIDKNVDLFCACCLHYGTHTWTLAHTLLLYAVLLKYIHKVEETDFQKRLRILRNLVEASVGDEIRAGEPRNTMPKLLNEVDKFIASGDLEEIKTFNQAQLKNEKDKAILIKSMSSENLKVLYELEDHQLLHGGLTVFGLETPSPFIQRAKMFISLFNKSDYQRMLITGALLAKGDYSRHETRWTKHDLCNFGTKESDAPWRNLFRGKSGDNGQHPASKPLMALLDEVIAGDTPKTVINRYINATNTPKDWRYYFVKYDSMREGNSGRYTISPSGYQVCMLEKERMHSYYYDTYLYAVVKLSEIERDSIANEDWPKCFSGDETRNRKLVLKNSGLQIECADKGWEITEIPTDLAQKAIFDQICDNHKISQHNSSYLYEIEQENGVDIEDRVEKAACLLKELVNKVL
jgi:Protein of unknown function DUF262